MNFERINELKKLKFIHASNGVSIDDLYLKDENNIWDLFLNHQK